METRSDDRGLVRPLVLLVDSDSVSRSRLARALVSDGFDVRLALGDFADAERPWLAIVHLDEQSGKASGALRALYDGFPKVPVMLRTNHPTAAAAHAKRIGLQVAEAFPTSESVRDVVLRAKQMVVGVAKTNPPSTMQEGRSPSSRRLAASALKRVPVLLVGRQDIGWFDGDPQEAALLAAIDGHSDLRALAARCGFDHPTVLRIVDALVLRGLVALESAG